MLFNKQSNIYNIQLRVIIMLCCGQKNNNKKIICMVFNFILS